MNRTLRQGMPFLSFGVLCSPIRTVSRRVVFPDSCYFWYALSPCYTAGDQLPSGHSDYRLC